MTVKGTLHHTIIIATATKEDDDGEDNDGNTTKRLLRREETSRERKRIGHIGCEVKTKTVLERGAILPGKTGTGKKRKGNLLIDNPFSHPSMKLDTKLPFSLPPTPTVSFAFR